MNKKREKIIKEAKKDFLNTMRHQMEATSLISTSLTDEETDLISTTFCFPQLLTYIMNMKNLENTDNIINKPDEVIRQYIIDRKEKKYLSLPEIALLLTELGFNPNDENTFYFAMYLNDLLFNNTEVKLKMDINKIKKALEKYRETLYHKPIWLEIIGDKNLSDDEITFRIIDYIKSHKERFKKPEDELKLTKKIHNNKS